jgi:hypothetical protein
MKKPRKTVQEGVWEKVNKLGPIPILKPELGNCWVWTSALNTKGYAQIGFKGRQPLVHVLVYGWEKGEIPSGYECDHLCRNRACVRPSHIEPVTRRDNILRGIGLAAENYRKTHCCNGHEYSKENTYIRPYGGRDCRICCRERTRQYYMRQRLSA